MGESATNGSITVFLSISLYRKMGSPPPTHPPMFGAKRAKEYLMWEKGLSVSRWGVALFGTNIRIVGYFAFRRLFCIYGNSSVDISR